MIEADQGEPIPWLSFVPGDDFLVATNDLVCVRFPTVLHVEGQRAILSGIGCIGLVGDIPGGLHPGRVLGLSNVLKHSVRALPVPIGIPAQGIPLLWAGTPGDAGDGLSVGCQLHLKLPTARNQILGESQAVLRQFLAVLLQFLQFCRARTYLLEGSPQLLVFGLVLVQKTQFPFVGDLPFACDDSRTVHVQLFNQQRLFPLEHRRRPLPVVGVGRMANPRHQSRSNDQRTDAHCSHNSSPPRLEHDQQHWRA